MKLIFTILFITVILFIFVFMHIRILNQTHKDLENKIGIMGEVIDGNELYLLYMVQEVHNIKEKYSELFDEDIN